MSNSHPSAGQLKDNIQEIRRFKKEALEINSNLQKAMLSLQEIKSVNLQEIQDKEARIAQLRNENRTIEGTMFKTLEQIRENDEKIRKFDQQLEDLTDGLLD